MSPDKLSSDTSAIENQHVSEDKTSGNNDKKLLKFDENNKVSPGKDINTKITTLDTDLAHLRAELGAINSSVEEGLDRLGDSDTDLTAKVSETYKRLGEIDNAYKSLLEISTHIDIDIQRLNGDVSTVAEQSATGIKTLEQSTTAQSNEFTHKNQQVVSRVNQLVETSKLTGEILSQKIQATTERILQVETHVIAEIESLSSVTSNKTGAIEASVENNKARILKLQSVDEAIIKRATTLEISSAELTVKSQDIQSSVVQLQTSSDSLSDGLDELREQTRALEDITANHGSLITSLQRATTDITDKLAVLANRESKHFNIFTMSFLLLLVVTGIIYYSQQSQFDVTDTVIAQRSEVVDAQIASLQQQQTSSAMAIEDKVTELNAAMQQEVAQVDMKVQEIRDQVQSVEGRFNNDSPFSQIGSDNIIHGSQWLAALPADNFVVQLAYVSDTATLYELAQRYSYYLKDSLSYFAVDVNGITKYVLLSGNYVTQQQAMTKITSMPRYIDMQQPVVRKLGVVQDYITQKN